MKPYISGNNALKHVRNEKKYKTRLQSAISQADDASKLSLGERLAKNSFIAKYKGNLNSPKKVTKKDLIRHQKKMKRRFNVEFPIEMSDSDDDNEALQLKSPTIKKRNMIIIGTPKQDKAKHVKNIDINARVETSPIQININTIDTTPALSTNRDMTKKRIQDSMDLIDTSATIPALPTMKENLKKRIIRNVEALMIGETESEQTETSTNDFKQPNSMAAQAGSTRSATVPATESYDDGNTTHFGAYIIL